MCLICMVSFSSAIIQRIRHFLLTRYKVAKHRRQWVGTAHHEGGRLRVQAQACVPNSKALTVTGHPCSLRRASREGCRELGAQAACSAGGSEQGLPGSLGGRRGHTGPWWRAGCDFCHLPPWAIARLLLLFLSPIPLVRRAILHSLLAHSLSVHHALCTKSWKRGDGWDPPTSESSACKVIQFEGRGEMWLDRTCRLQKVLYMAVWKRRHVERWNTRLKGRGKAFRKRPHVRHHFRSVLPALSSCSVLVSAPVECSCFRYQSPTYVLP